MADLNLPADLATFLKRDEQPEYDAAECEAGCVTLLPLEQLKLELFPMTPDSPDDPHAGEYGSYLVQGVSLVAECDGYNPKGLLLWLPLDKRYGLWDGEHGTLRVFSTDVGWPEIVRKFPQHINAAWKLDGSASVSDLTPWVRHPYNPEELHHALPDIPEWYEARWVRRGVYRDGVQLRFPEELRIRIECDGERCKVTSQFKKPEESAEWSPAERRLIPPREWELSQPWLEAGFWTQPSRSGGEHGETETMWSLAGYRTSRYHTLFRSYDETGAAGDAVHDLGKCMAQLAQIPRFESEH